MSRLFWDSMLLIYLVEDHPVFSKRTEEILARAKQRGDTLFTSYLALGEVLAGAGKSPYPQKTATIEQALREIGFNYLPFDAGAVEPFRRLRSSEKLRVVDCIHLACAASAGMDLFLTGDKQLFRLIVSGIHFIADFNASIF